MYWIRISEVPEKAEIADALRETGQLLKVQGANKFRAKAYFVAAKVLDELDENLGELIEQNRLTELSGVGPAVASFIKEFHEGGSSSFLNNLRDEFAPGTAELSQLDGLTVKRIAKAK
jgi:DNA polymerase (family 10)